MSTEDTPPPNSWGDVIRTTLFLFLLCIVCTWLVSAMHCVAEYNGGRILQCATEVFWQEIPNPDP